MKALVSIACALCSTTVLAWSHPSFDCSILAPMTQSPDYQFTTDDLAFQFGGARATVTAFGRGNQATDPADKYMITLTKGTSSAATTVSASEVHVDVILAVGDDTYTASCWRSAGAK